MVSQCVANLEWVLMGQQGMTDLLGAADTVRHCDSCMHCAMHAAGLLAEVGFLVFRVKRSLPNRQIYFQHSLEISTSKSGQ